MQNYVSKIQMLQVNPPPLDDMIHEHFLMQEDLSRERMYTLEVNHDRLVLKASIKIIVINIIIISIFTFKIKFLDFFLFQSCNIIHYYLKEVLNRTNKLVRIAN